MKPEERRAVIPELRALGRHDLVKYHEEQLAKEAKKK